ncbi:MAG TPA: oxygenase MpaB family protein [Candidatus Nanopelagicales bacterium]|nr:oxygenase MpaB family protein [Candidatus Nanopelagicales bacterium]
MTTPGGDEPITVAPPTPRVGPVARAFRTLLSGDPQGTPSWVEAIATGDRDCLVVPDGPSWAVHGSLTTLVGGVRALMLQSLHPAAVSGVAEHSAFEDDTVGRLRRTTRWLIVTTFGDVATAERAASGVRRMHERVTGSLDAGLVGGEPGASAAYSASDPDLLRWVHDAFTDSFLSAHLALGGPAIPGGPDAYVAEWARSAVLLGATGLPASRAELTAQLDAFRALPGYGRAPATREVARFLRSPALPVAFRLPYRVLASAAAATLDERDAALLGLRQDPHAVGRAKVLLHVLLWALSATSPAERAARLRLGLPPRR